MNKMKTKKICGGAMQNLKGLTSKEAETSAKKYGKNRIPMPKKKGFAALFFKGLLDPIILVLLASVALNALFSFGSLNWFETGGILAAVLLSTLVSALSEHSGSRAFEKLKAESENGSARLLRDGEVRYYPVTEIVTGDLVFLSAGEKIPAAVRMTRSGWYRLYIDMLNLRETVIFCCRNSRLRGNPVKNAACGIH